MSCLCMLYDLADCRSIFRHVRSIQVHTELLRTRSTPTPRKVQLRFLTLVSLKRPRHPSLPAAQQQQHRHRVLLQPLLQRHRVKYLALQSKSLLLIQSFLIAQAQRPPQTTTTTTTMITMHPSLNKQQHQQDCNANQQDAVDFHYYIVQNNTQTCAFATTRYHQHNQYMQQRCSCSLL
jgi:hypothetical protein